MTGLKVINPGMLSLIQDTGRHGFHNIGITSGGPFDNYSADWANRLLENSTSATCLEVLVGGLTLESQITTQISRLLALYHLFKLTIQKLSLGEAII